MKISIKNYFKPEHVEAILSALCKKFDVDLRSIDIYVRLEKDKENAECYEVGTVEEIGILYRDLYKTDPANLGFSDDIEILTTSEVDERKRQIAKRKEFEEFQNKIRAERIAIERAKGYIGLIQRGGFYRFFVRKELIKGKESSILQLQENEKVICVYYVADNNEAKKQLRKQYANQAIDDNPRQSLFNFTHDDIEEIERYLKSIEIKR